METKTPTQTINIPNYNNKFFNDVFIHIAPAPSKPIMASTLPMSIHIEEVIREENKTVLEMLASENKKPISIDVEMIDFVRLELWQIGSTWTYMSHGIDRETFIHNLSQNNESATASDKFAIYVYKKVSTK